MIGMCVYICTQVPVDPQAIETKLTKMRKASQHLGISETKVSLIALSAFPHTIPTLPPCPSSFCLSPSLPSAPPPPLPVSLSISMHISISRHPLHSSSLFLSLPPSLLSSLPPSLPSSPSLPPSLPPSLRPFSLSVSRSLSNSCACVRRLPGIHKFELMRTDRVESLELVQRDG